MESKKEIRKRILKEREALTPAERYRSALLITESILSHDWYEMASHILLFASYGSEISTNKLMRTSLTMGKKVYMPRVEGDTIEFYRILSKNDLFSGYKDILEPDGTSEKFVFIEKFKNNPDEVLMIMPGVAFDPNRNRIGYGKGFYDKYLSDKPKLRTIAIGFDCQMVRYIDADTNDIKPMQVICL